MAKSVYDRTSAESKSIGFDYQYYFFLLQLLGMKDGETIGLEVKDDIHVDLPDGTLSLIQLKHTVQTNATNEPTNLTERDIDLWKTIHNWISVIEDKSLGRTSEKAKREFITSTQFILVSNKGSSSKNAFLTKLTGLKSGTLTIMDLKQYLKELHEDTKDSESNKELKQYILELYMLNENTLKLFVEKIEFRLEEDDLIKRIKAQIRNYWVPDEKIDDVYNALNSNLRDNIYFTVKSRAKILITYNDFRMKYRKCFPSYLNLPIRRYPTILPNDYHKQTFIRQLIDIGDIKSSEKEEMIRLTKLKLLMFNNLNQWLQSGELTEQQKKVFYENCVTQWKTLHRAKHRLNTRSLENGKSLSDIEDAIKESSLECLDEIRKIVLSIEGQQLDAEISNGHFYLLSDEPMIGWHLDWENKYKK